MATIESTATSPNPGSSATSIIKARDSATARRRAGVDAAQHRGSLTNGLYASMLVTLCRDRGRCSPAVGSARAFTQSRACGIRGEEALHTMIDELSPIVRYIAHEMIVNARCDVTKRIRRFNTSDGDACVTEFFKGSMWRAMFGALSPQACANMLAGQRTGALVMWTLQVMEGGPWDHKPILKAKFRSSVDPVSRQWHQYGDQMFFHDVWSNLHYGYVGVAAGFSEGMLLDGAGLEQVGSDVLHKRWPLRSPGVRGLRAWDHAHDRVAVAKGIELYKRFPAGISESIVMDAVRNTVDIALTQPFPGTLP
jgi:hypothetical protein